MNKEYIDFLNNFKDKIKNDKNWEKEEIHEYEKAIIEFIKDNQYKNNFIKYLQEIMNERTDKVTEDVLYAAYCTLHTYYRRMGKYSELANLDQKYSELFQEKHISSEHFRLLLYVDSSPLKIDFSILEKAEKSASSMPDHTGAWHLLADLTTRYYENQNDLDFISVKQEEWYQKGIKAVNKAIEKERDYAKFYATRARLYCLSGEYAKALEDIQIAMKKENPLNFDYLDRLNRYQFLKCRIESQIM